MKTRKDIGVTRRVKKTPKIETQKPKLGPDDAIAIMLTARELLAVRQMWALAMSNESWCDFGMRLKHRTVMAKLNAAVDAFETKDLQGFSLNEMEGL